MREMLSPTSAIVGMKLDTTVALLTDGRFSGASCGAAIGHISPEQLQAARSLTSKTATRSLLTSRTTALKLLVSDEEMEERKKTMKDPRAEEADRILKTLCKNVSSADKGAIVE